MTLNEVCPPGVDVARYLNYHEDLGSLSLALGSEAIASTQQIAIPTAGDPESWLGCSRRQRTSSCRRDFC